MAAQNKIFQSTTYKVNSPSSTLYVHILENELGNPEQVQINAGKCGSEVAACCNAIGLLASRLLKQEDGLDMLLEDLSNITTDRISMNTDGLVCRSIPEGVFVALMRYRNEKSVTFMDVNVSVSQKKICSNGY